MNPESHKDTPYHLSRLFSKEADDTAKILGAKAVYRSRVEETVSTHKKDKFWELFEETESLAVKQEILAIIVKKWGPIELLEITSHCSTTTKPQEIWRLVMVAHHEFLSLIIHNPERVQMLPSRRYLLEALKRELDSALQEDYELSKEMGCTIFEIWRKFLRVLGGLDISNDDDMEANAWNWLYTREREELSVPQAEFMKEFFIEKHEEWGELMLEWYNKHKASLNLFEDRNIKGMLHGFGVESSRVSGGIAANLTLSEHNRLTFTALFGDREKSICLGSDEQTQLVEEIKIQAHTPTSLLESLFNQDDAEIVMFDNEIFGSLFMKAFPRMLTILAEDAGLTHLLVAAHNQKMAQAMLNAINGKPITVEIKKELYRQMGYLRDLQEECEALDEYISILQSLKETGVQIYPLVPQNGVDPQSELAMEQYGKQIKGIRKRERKAKLLVMSGGTPFLCPFKTSRIHQEKRSGRREQSLVPYLQEAIPRVKIKTVFGRDYTVDFDGAYTGGIERFAEKNGISQPFGVRDLSKTSLSNVNYEAQDRPDMFEDPCKATMGELWDGMIVVPKGDDDDEDPPKYFNDKPENPSSKPVPIAPVSSSLIGV